MKRGSYESAFDNSSKISLVRYNDNAVVTMCSNNFSVQPLNTAKRYNRKEKDPVEGKYVNNRVILDSTAAPKRTDESFLAQNDEEHHTGDESFLAQNDEEHHTGISPLLRLNIGMGSQKDR
ncbi:hypothetical protein QE152_g23641 [Popillia japonica]|uniref:Uncharacterized protein n=1 Tax=Popillia japonica TaxID=7064 RepID=A0AAW1KGQ6_POPJA